MPREKGAIYTCKFMCTTEIAVFSIKCRVKLNINMAHCLLGHQNEDSVRKISREFGWVLMHGRLQTTCKHHAKSKAKKKGRVEGDCPIKLNLIA